MLTEKETIKKMESLGFIHSTFEEWEVDSRKTLGYAGCIQSAPSEMNLNNLNEFNATIYIKKFYIVGLADNRFEIRAWGVYS